MVHPVVEPEMHGGGSKSLDQLTAQFVTPRSSVYQLKKVLLLMRYRR